MRLIILLIMMMTMNKGEKLIITKLIKIKTKKTPLTSSTRTMMKKTIKIKQKIQIERKPIAAKKILPKTEMEMKRKLIYVLTQKKLAK